MCILSYLPPSVHVDEEGLFNGGMRNPDGHGWAIVVNRAIISGKSLNLYEALEEFGGARKEHPDGPALFHSRWATHGTVDVSNVHPFPVGGSPSTVVAHNGILPAAAHPGAGDERSDTRKFADEILPRQFRRLDRRKVQRRLSEWCGSGNKLVILTADARYRRAAYIINETLGEWDRATGIWHSNGDYRDQPSWLDDELEAQRRCGAGDWPDYLCLLCQYGEIDRNGYCEICRACQDCQEHIADCLCWSGGYVAMRPRGADGGVSR